VLAALAYVIWPTAVLFASDLYSEPLGTFCFMGFLACALTFAADKKAWIAVLSGALLGYAVLTRPNFVFMLAFATLWLCWVFRRTPRTLLAGMLLPTAAIAVIFPWSIRNYFVLHRLVPLSTMGGSGLLQGNNRIVASDPKLHGYSIWDSRIPEYHDALHSAGDEIERDRRAGAFAVQWLKEHRNEWLSLAVAKIIRGWTPVLQSNSPALYRVLTLLSWGPVLLLFLASFIPTFAAALKRAEPRLLLHLAIVNALLINVIFWGELRYRHGVEPLCLIWAALSAVTIYDWVRKETPAGVTLESPREPFAAAPV
jgi:4-amino-4-deoxy-L-arabinose transferase-like glycosyltransferase